ncbi:MAG TPA: hypothetical protein VMM13_03200, partial [Euzebya sp.]|nr:hypothetical protein [Euzebya sp.]
MSGVTRALGILALLALAAGVGLLVLTAGDGLVTGERGPRLGALVHGNLATAVLVTAAGVLLAVGAATRRMPVVLAAAALLLGGAAVHLIGIAVGSDLLGASGSTVAAFLGLGGAALAIGAT